MVVLQASGKETRGAGTASATVRSELAAEGDQTRVTVHTNLNVTGKPAQFGRGVLNEVGGRLVGIFADNLAKMIAAEPEAAEAAASLRRPPPLRRRWRRPPSPRPRRPPGGPRPARDRSGSAGIETAAGSAAGHLSAPIEELSLPLRAYNSLRREGVHTVGDLVARTPQELLAIENIGPASVEEIRQRLADRGLSLSEAPASANGAERPASAFPAPAAAATGGRGGDAAAAHRPAAARRAVLAGLRRRRDRPAQRGRVAGAQAGAPGRGRACSPPRSSRSACAGGATTAASGARCARRAWRRLARPRPCS